MQLDSLNPDSQKYRELADNFDGYALYQRMGWIKAQDTTVKFTRGIFTEIPRRGYVGWVCSWTGDSVSNKADGVYVCQSKFISLTNFSASQPPDFEQAKPPSVVYDTKTDLQELQNGNFSCKVV